MNWYWTVIILIAIGLLIVLVWNFYKFYKNASDEDRPKLLKIYGALFVVSVVIVIVVRTFWGSDYKSLTFEDIQEQQRQEYFNTK